MKNVLKQSFVLCMCSVLVLVHGSCKHEAPKRELPPVVVEVLSIDTVSGGLTRTYVGEVEENLSVAMSFPAGGRVERVYVSEGDYVHAGQLLAEVNNSNAQNAYNSAKASLQQAEDAYQRLKKVYEKGSLAEVKWVETPKSATMLSLRKNWDSIRFRAFFTKVKGQ